MLGRSDTLFGAYASRFGDFGEDLLLYRNTEYFRNMHSWNQH